MNKNFNSQTAKIGSISTNSQMFYKERILNVLQTQSMTQAEIKRNIKYSLASFSRKTLSDVLKILIVDGDLKLVPDESTSRSKYCISNYMKNPDKVSQNYLFYYNHISIENENLLNDFLQQYEYKSILNFFSYDYKEYIINYLLKKVDLLTYAKQEDLQIIMKEMFFLTIFHEFWNETELNKINVSQKELNKLKTFKIQFLQKELIFFTNSTNELHLDEQHTLYIFKDGIIHDKCMALIRKEISSCLNYLVLCEQNISLRMVFPIFINIVSEIKRKFKQNKINIKYYQLNRIVQTYPFQFYKWLAPKVLNFLIKEINDSKNYATTLLCPTIYQLKSSLSSILKAPPKYPHLYYNLIEKAILRLMSKPNKTKSEKIAFFNDIFEVFNIKSDFKSFFSLFCKRSSISQTTLYYDEKNQLSFQGNRRKLKFFGLTMLILQLFYLKTKMITETSKTNKNIQKYEDLIKFYDLLYRNILKKIRDYKSAEPKEGMAFRNLAMFSSKNYEKILNVVNQSLKDDDVFLIAKYPNYRKFLDISNRVFNDSKTHYDENYLLKLLLLYRKYNSSFKTMDLTQYFSYLEKSKNPMIILLYIENLTLVPTDIRSNLAKRNKKIKFYFLDKQKHISKKLELLTGVLTYFQENLNFRDDENSEKMIELYSICLETLTKFLIENVDKNTNTINLDLRWYLNLLSIYYYLKEDPKLALFFDLINLSFSFEQRALFPETLLFQINQKIHCISRMGTKITPNPYFMIPSSILLKILYLLKKEKVRITDITEIFKHSSNKKFEIRDILNLIDVIFKNSATKGEKYQDQNQKLNYRFSIFTKNGAIFKFCSHLQKSILNLNQIFSNVQFKNLIKSEILRKLFQQYSVKIIELNEFLIRYQPFLNQFKDSWFQWIRCLTNLVQQNYLTVLHQLVDLKKYYKYCIPLQGLHLLLNIQLNFEDKKEKLYQDLFKLLIKENENYPRYTVYKYKNRWKLYQFPWIYKIMLNNPPNKNFEQYRMILEYFHHEYLLYTNLKQKEKQSDLKKYHEKLVNFYSKRGLNSYYSTSDTDSPGFNSSLGYYIPDPRLSRLDSLNYANKPKNIIL